MPFINIGLFFEDIQTAFNFLDKYAPGYKQSEDPIVIYGDRAFVCRYGMLCFYFQKVGSEMPRWLRCHFIFTTPKVRGSEWYPEGILYHLTADFEGACREDGTMVGDWRFDHADH